MSVAMIGGSIDSPDANGENAASTIPMVAPAPLIEFVMSHRNESVWETVRLLLQGVGMLLLMFLLAFLGLLIAFQFVMWVL